MIKKKLKINVIYGLIGPHNKNQGHPCFSIFLATRLMDTISDTNQCLLFLSTLTHAEEIITIIYFTSCKLVEIYPCLLISNTFFTWNYQCDELAKIAIENIFW